jgi:hypothetical protein
METSRPMEMFFPSRVIKRFPCKIDQLHFDQFFREFEIECISCMFNMLCHSCLKIIPTRLLRHMWPDVVMENHTHTPAVHGKSHKYVHTFKLYNLVGSTKLGLKYLKDNWVLGTFLGHF